MSIPHTFPTLIDADASREILLIGAGMSSNIAPSVAQLAGEVANDHDAVIKKLGIDPSPPPSINDFFDWAERAVTKLKSEAGLPDVEAKVRLADAIGVTTDPRYRGDVATVSLRKHWTRHRVAARFAREGRWRAIWSLNWDCVLESALECVGLREHPGGGPSNDLPWEQWYTTWTPGDPLPPAGLQGTFYVCKPHGCVKKIRTGNALFIVTSSELKALTPQLRPAAEEMSIGFAHAPLVTAGWRAEEDYLCKNIEVLRDRGTLLNSGSDRLSIINRSWYPKADAGGLRNHERIAATFGVGRAECFFEVGTTGNPTIDDLFQWVQTRYFLGLLAKYAQHSEPWTTYAPLIDEVAQYFVAPKPNHIINGLVDDFLSVWVRLCFNTGHVVFMRHGAAVQQKVVPVARRDEHIPWAYGHTVRNDLLAVIPLLLAIWHKESAASAAMWNFSEYPGALWRGADGHLVLPLPAWNNTSEPIDLSALKPLVESRNWERKGSIRKLSVLPLLSLPDAAEFLDHNLVMRASVASLMNLAAFAVPKELHVIRLADI